MNATEVGRLFGIDVAPELARLVDDACATVAAYEPVREVYEQAMAALHPLPPTTSSDRTDEV